jgi:hypothetical protein
MAASLAAWDALPARTDHRALGKMRSMLRIFEVEKITTIYLDASFTEVNVVARQTSKPAHHLRVRWTRETRSRHRCRPGSRVDEVRPRFASWKAAGRAMERPDIRFSEGAATTPHPDERPRLQYV